MLCGCYPLAIYFTFGSICKPMPLSHFVPAYPSPSPCPPVHLYVYIFIPVLPLDSSEPFFSSFLRFHIYVLAYSICFALSGLLHSVWQSLGPSTSLKIISFLFMLSNIPLHTCATSSLSIHLSMDTCIASVSWPLQIELSCFSKSRELQWILKGRS